MKNHRVVWVDLENLFANSAGSQVAFFLSQIDEALAASTGKVSVVGNLLWEKFYPRSHELDQFLDQCLARQVDLIVFLNDRCHQHEIIQHIKAHHGRVFLVDYFLYRVYQELIVRQCNAINARWNHRADKFLMLTGKPDRIHRAGLLWRLYRDHLLDKSIWSFFVPVDRKARTLEILIEQGATLQEAEDFIANRARSADNTPVIFLDGHIHQTGIPYDDTMFQQVKFRVISESAFGTSDPVPFLTEKTWITIANRCPFIMAGTCHSLQYLESLGFRTFREYLSIPDYDEIQDKQQRLEAIVTNVNHWISDSGHRCAIQDDVEHNFHHFVALGKKIKTVLIETIAELGLDCDPEDLVITEDLVTLKQKGLI